MGVVSRRWAGVGGLKECGYIVACIWVQLQGVDFSIITYNLYPYSCICFLAAASLLLVHFLKSFCSYFVYTIFK